MNPWSLVYVPGAEFMDTKDVPHGAVSEVTYYSSSLRRFRRMHVYTPPGYESGTKKYPIFYLLHGAWDTDAAWTTVGRAGFIFDNLIAENKAVPMVVIMPAGHTEPFPTFTPPPPGPRRDEFVDDFLKDLKPYAERNYRVFTDRDHRAIAGLSMGGMQTLDIAMPHLGDFSYIGVYSSGIFELGQRNVPAGSDKGPSWEERNSTYLDNQNLKKGLHLLWFAIGKEDFLLGISNSTVSLLKKHGFDIVSQETSGGHTWNNWREYLAQFAPLLFRSRNK
jgi:enterochelin esterase-like enzyme